MTTKIELEFDVARTDSDFTGRFLVSSDVDLELIKSVIIQAAIYRFYLCFKPEDFVIDATFGNQHKLKTQHLFAGFFHGYNSAISG